MRIKLPGKLPRFMITLGRGVSLTVFVLAIWHVLLASLLGYQKDNNDQLVQLIQHKNTEISLFIQRQKQIAEFETRLRFIADLRDQNRRTAELINEFNQAIPSAIELNHVRREGKILWVEGNSASDVELVHFMENLAKSRLLTQPVITSMRTSQAQSQDKHEFKLMMRVRT